MKTNDCPSKKIRDTIIRNVKDDMPVLCIIKVFDKSRKKQIEIAVNTDYLSIYYNHKGIKSNRKYYRKVESLLDGKKLIINDSIDFDNNFRRFVIDDKDYIQMNEVNLNILINEYFTNDSTISKNYDKKKFNSLVKILYNNDFLIYQEDLTGLYKTTKI